MHRRRIKYTLIAIVLALSGWICPAQSLGSGSGELSVPNVNGIFVDPVPNAPFSGVLEISLRQKLSDGSFNDLRTINNIARDSMGRTYQENRRLVAPHFQDEPPLTSFHIYDPNTELDTRLDPFTFIARQSTRKEARPAPGLVPVSDPATATPPMTAEDLGPKSFDGVMLRGTRQTKGDAVDEYWYSQDLALYLIRKHIDPKWEQTFTVTKVNRSEPDPAKFIIPKDYKITQFSPPVPPLQVAGTPGLYHVGGGVSAPRLLHSENPKYTDQARQAKLNGICVLSLTVGADGIPTDMRVVRKLGMGLDEQAILAVSKYRFEPAKLNGNPVPVEISIEVNFKIY
jgi:TonB family protein